MKALITRKVGMTSTISEDGIVQAVTLLSATPNVVTQVKNEEIDGYNAIQLGFETKGKLSKSQSGHAKPSKSAPKIIKEIRLASFEQGLNVGTSLSADVFSVGDKVSVTGTSKGKGWGGTIKRHNFHRQRKTHGGKGNTRQPGSIGSMYPQHIFKGKKMAGQTGGDKTTVKNLEVALVDKELAIIGVVGAVPGPKKGLVILKQVSIPSSVEQTQEDKS